MAAALAVTAGTHQAPLPLVSDSGLVAIGLAVTGQTTSGDVDSSEHERTSRTVNTAAARDASHSPVPHPAALLLPTQFPVETHQQTIDARSKKYGSFKSQAVIAQNIKASYAGSENWQELPDDMRESLDCIATKISRILNGDFCQPDSWHDIAGYAMLIEDRLRKANEQQSQSSA
jgi:hypothetical protein